MTLEQRLRSELRRTAPDSVPAAPSIAEFEATISSRRRRNRLMAGAGAAALALVVGVAGAVALWPDDDPAVVATASDGSAETVEEVPAGAGADAATDAVEQPAADTAEQTGDDAAESSPLVEAPAAETTETAELPDAGSEISVATQESAVEFAGGSGVLLVRTDDGFAGIASKFGGDAGVQAIGLRSADGLDWNEVVLDGVPAGATATAMTSHDAGYAALFSRFDVDAQRNLTFVGTSSDLVEWSLSDPLPGGSGSVPVAIASGPSGVIVVGTAPAPAVWTGSPAGPYERVGSVADADSLAGVVAIDSGFVAVGTSTAFGPTLFDSVDGTEWTASPMSGIGDGDTIVNIAVMDGTIMLAGDDGDMAWAATSADGGQSWQRNEVGSGTVLSVASSRNTVGFLGTSPLGATTLTLTDGESWSSVELDVAAPDRIALLVAGADRAVLLSTTADGLTWIVAER